MPILEKESYQQSVFFVTCNSGLAAHYCHSGDAEMTLEHLAGQVSCVIFTLPLQQCFTN